MTAPTWRLIALHGFIGGPGDWESVRALMPWAEVDALDLWPLTAAAGEDGWESVGKLLEEELAARAAREPALPAVVLAYSFGARLALAVEALAAGRLPVAATCLVSCNPGLPVSDLAVRGERREADERWARMFMRSTEAEIREAWENQAVLDFGRQLRRAGGTAPQEDLSDHFGSRGLPAPRYTLAVAMRKFSLADQPDFRTRLGAWRGPLLWVTGENDGKFTEIARELRFSGVPADFVICERAGHRVPWDNPSGFESALRGWLAMLPGARGTRR